MSISSSDSDGDVVVVRFFDDECFFRLERFSVVDDDDDDDFFDFDVDVVLELSLSARRCFSLSRRLRR
jgi:hypothetical protein